MRVAVVLTYPIHHDPLPRAEWIARISREHRIVALLRRMGHPAELWAAGMDPLRLSPLVNGTECPIRVFPVDPSPLPAKMQISSPMVDHARNSGMDAFILKGLDGGAGLHLLDRLLIPAARPFAFIIGGTWHSSRLKYSRVVLVETRKQRSLLASPWSRILRTRMPAEKLVTMPKQVDLKSFHPLPGPREWDILSVGRTARVHDKNFPALYPLAGKYRVAVAGGGCRLKELRAAHPEILWLGHIPHSRLPGIYNRARVFVHTGKRDFFPRVIAEAMACGLPCAAFGSAIAGDVIPRECGLRVNRRGLASGVSRLLRDPERRKSMGEQARRHAESSFGEDALRKALEGCLERLQ